jgi:hypothetical protein
VATFQSSPTGARLLGTAATAAAARVLLEALEVGTAGVLLRTDDPLEVRRVLALLLAALRAWHGGRPAAHGPCRAGGGRCWLCSWSGVLAAPDSSVPGHCWLGDQLPDPAWVQVRQLAAYLRARNAESAQRLVYDVARVVRVSRALTAACATWPGSAAGQAFNTPTPPLTTMHV